MATLSKDFASNQFFIKFGEKLLVHTNMDNKICSFRLFSSSSYIDKVCLLRCIAPETAKVLNQR